MKYKKGNMKGGKRGIVKRGDIRKEIGKYGRKEL